ncbi:MAG: RnfABCDGE type electron transport complex subunit G [Eubacteriales bacterium]|nr:RnfABCDGE type electron transport complex subunit G [Eubacteriales bacterium]
MAEKNNNKVKQLFKDAIILTVITLTAGFSLALLNEVTKGPIAAQAYEKKMAAYNTVFPEAKSFEEDEAAQTLTAAAADLLSTSGLGKVGVEEVLSAVDEGGNTVGFVAIAYSDEGYGGKVRISLGYDTEAKAVTKIAILEAAETPGLGAKISEPNFYEQFTDKAVEQFVVQKGGASAEEDIAAISGATISSTAVTHAVNGALLVFEGGGK